MIKKEKKRCDLVVYFKYVTLQITTNVVFLCDLIVSKTKTQWMSKYATTLILAHPPSKSVSIITVEIKSIS